MWLAVGTVAALTAVAWVAIAQAGSGSGSGEPAAQLATHSAHQTTPTLSTPPATERNVVNPGAAACVQEIKAAEAVVAAAGNAAEHWREHVQARTDLLAGKNSEEQTKAIWKRTRLLGPADGVAVNSAVAERTKVNGGCAGLPGKAAAVCKQRLATLDAVGATYRAAARDWATHLQAMAAHAAGEFGAEHAQELWVAAWTGATRNLNAAARATATLADVPTCKPA
ncbi:hypothetical protein [Kribbella sindirgiensis]|uniref:DUF4439 domain-containing protein n=1 Tax=Kribbella sindirgiensis TaxID=1124744 RepID=A0A4R0I2F3_9ACTN|nr:hypothetical protein [Kribbella sindirgiensis]TCC19226.1 hypothetical protein E0H50_37975 [Kribbella sindirgiensis]